MKQKTMLHLTQAKHNEKLLNYLHAEIADNFFDWKITVSFYAALHYIKAYSYNQNKQIGDSHYDMLNNINPSFNSALLPFPKYIFDCYMNLYNYSRYARYSGMVDNENHRKKLQLESIVCSDYLIKTKEYLVSKNFNLLVE
ncbi:MAG: hypothetical protein RO257_04145 [Candidatus Kapabacteria bacterium]|jgi:hypothetical protein|nr:hypothetical protein [Candidatus Kapabacteria bacterium]